MPKQITLPSGTKRWQVRWRDDTGTQRSKNFARHVDAVAHEHKTRNALAEGTYVRVEKTTVADWADTWLAGAHNLRPRAKLAYQRDLGRINAAIGALRLDQVTETHLDDLLTSMAAEGLSPAYVHRHYRTLRRMFRVAVQRRKLIRSPLDNVAAPHVPTTEMRFLTALELTQLASVPTLGAYRTLVLVAGWGGLRWGELAGLRAGRVDVVGSRVQVVTQLDPEGTSESEPKSKAGRRWVSLPRLVAAELSAQIEGKGPGELVWTSPTGKPLRHTNFVRRTFTPAAAQAGLPGLTPHDLRHTAVALAIAAGAHPKAIQQRMGHSSIMVTLDRYGHLFPEMDERLADRLNDTVTAAALIGVLRAV
jgi:integrase